MAEKRRRGGDSQNEAEDTEGARRHRQTIALGIVAGIVVPLLVLLATRESKATPDATIERPAGLRSVVVPSAAAQNRESQTDDCGAWEADLIESADTAGATPLDLLIAAPAGSPSTITEIIVHYLGKERVDDPLLAMCGTGGGPEPGYIASFALEEPVPTVEVEFDYDDMRPMPPATIEIEAGEAKWLTLTPVGDDGYTYRWWAELTIVTDRHSATHTVGSVESPMATYVGDAWSLARRQP